MKLITAIIDPELLSRVMRALHALPHFPGVTISDAQGQGRGEGEGGKFVSKGKPWAFAKRVRLQLACKAPECDSLVQVIRDNAHDGKLGNGIIMVSSLDHVIRVVGGEQEDEAL